MEDLIKILHDGKHSLVVANGSVKTYDGRGITDIFNLLNNDPEFLDGSEIADKIVGKGAAALMVLGNVSAVYADVISEPALDLFRRYAVKVYYGQVVQNIINRRGDGICPVEKICMPCDKAIECLPLIRDFVILNNGRNN